MIHISQEEISSRISEVIDCSLIKPQSQGLHKNNIHIVTCNNGYTGQAFKHYGGEKVAGFSYKKNDSVKSGRGGCILFTVIILILFSYFCS